MAEWQAYYQVEPFGQERGDMQAGIVRNTLLDIWRDPKKPAKERRASDAVLKFTVPGDEEIDLEASARATVAAFKELTARQEAAARGEQQVVLQRK